MCGVCLCVFGGMGEAVVVGGGKRVGWWWAKLSAVRLGLVDKVQVKLGNQRDYLTWIPICVAKSRKLLKHNFELDKLGQVYSVNTRQYKDAKSK